MSSILTNNGAIVALQTLKSVNSSLTRAQNEISTGKAVGNAKDNSAIWAISKVMESDVSAFKTLSESLSLGQSTVAVARAATETTQDLLNQIKSKIVSAQGENIDRGKLQDDINKLTDQIRTAVSAAQFNGLNLVNGTADEATKVLSSLDRSTTGVTSNSISVASNDLLVGVKVTSASAAKATVAAAGTTAALTFAFQGTGTPTTAMSMYDDNASLSDATKLLAGDTIALRFGDKSVSYTIKKGDTAALINTGMQAALTKAGVTNVTWAGGQATNGTGAALDMEVVTTRGSMGQLGVMDVSTTESAAHALSDIEGMLQSAINAGASYGANEKRIEIQNDFLGKLTDAMRQGIGAMVDANMEEASARLQALQTQQQLGIQALSIANQAPSSILALFR